jgi:hypothetical protein
VTAVIFLVMNFPLVLFINFREFFLASLTPQHFCQGCAEWPSSVPIKPLISG